MKKQYAKPALAKVGVLNKVTATLTDGGLLS